MAKEAAENTPIPRAVLGSTMSLLAEWTLRVLIVAGGLWLLFYLAGLLWPVLLALFLALLLSS